MSNSTVELQYRRFLLVLAAFIFVGSIVELEFIEHYESTIQYIPFMLAGVGFILALTALKKSTSGVLKTLRYAMILIFAGGVFGLYQHLEHNYEFAMEISPNISVVEALVKALYGASPFLAPGILCLGAILAYAATWSHPELENSQL